MVTNTANPTQLIHRLVLSTRLVPFRAERNTAKKAMIKNPMSKQRHHAGAEAQQDSVHAAATNKNGVAMQWIKHKKLAAAPRRSDFCLRVLSIGTLQEFKNSSFLANCNIVAFTSETVCLPPWPHPALAHEHAATLGTPPRLIDLNYILSVQFPTFTVKFSPCKS